MPTANLLTLIDDIAAILDDVAVLSKVAAKKTAGVLGDDLALNAQQVTGVHIDRELPVVWAVAKGSARNKIILVPAALLISAVAPSVVTMLLMLGGAYLCFEGFEKLAHPYLHDHNADQAHHAELAAALADPKVDMLALEHNKIKGAIRTDFILSAEIVVITLGTVAAQPLMLRISVLVSIAALMTIGVYGLVAAIVKLDDLGLYLNRRNNPAAKIIGRSLLLGAPYLMKALSVAGTAAMFLVGGGIVVHGWTWLHHLTTSLLERLTLSLGASWGWLEVLLEPLLHGATGVALGALVLAGVVVGKKILRASFGRARVN
jgi:uncharacterized protein